MAIADALQSWVSDVQAYALDQAVNHNKEWPGYKLIEAEATGDMKTKLKRQKF